MNQRQSYQFRSQIANVFLGTASDRYKGWIGQIYNRPYRLSVRTKTVGGQRFKEEVLEVASVVEYFEHFGFLELDFTFYSFLVDQAGKPSTAHRALSRYAESLPPDARVFVKVPQRICARKMWTTLPGQKKRVFAVNPDYLRADLFTDQFYRQLTDILGDKLMGMIFEFGYQRAADCPAPSQNIEALRDFVTRLPVDGRYHFEERTNRLKTPEYFNFLRGAGVGNVLSHWTYLPPLRQQTSQQRSPTHPDVQLVRLMTPLGIRYEDAYARYFPFDQLKDALPEMYDDAAEIVSGLVDANIQVYFAVNNRAGGNAPEIARRMLERMEGRSDGQVKR